jgi:hypothetical protein
VADYEYQADLDIGDIKKRLEQAAKEFDQFAKKAEAGLDKAAKAADKTAKSTKSTGDSAATAGDKFKNIINKAAGLTAIAGTITAIAVAVRDLVGAAAEAETAQFNLAASANAANQEFGDSVGNLESWQKTLQELGDEVKVFSDKELDNAGSRLIDMTKRLGFTQEQMEEILRRSADVGAGKFGIEDTIERVSAALRGEAEAAEALGLTLSETAVKQYAEQHGLVFNEMTDGEKAQARYNLLLEQTNQVQGRAAQFAETLAGKQQALNAQLENNKVVIGSQLIPLYDGWARAVGLVAMENEEGAGLITRALAGVVAALLTVGVGFTTWAESARSAIGTVGAGFNALLAGENPLTAMSAEFDRTRESAAGFGEFIKNIPGTFNTAFDQLVDGWTEQRKAAENVSVGLAGLPPVYNEAGEAAGEAAVSAEDYEKALEKIQKAHDDFKTDKARDELDALVKAERAAADAAVDAARQREAIALKNQQAIEDIARKNEQALAEAGIEAGRDEEDAARESSRNQADITRSLAQKQIDIARQAAQKKVDIETAYRRKIQEIAQKFSIAALDAERSRDAVAFLAAKRERDLGFAGAATERDQGLQDVNTETGRAQEAAQTEAEAAREQERIRAEQAAEDRAIENERKMEDLRAQIERELAEQALANERELEAQRVKEEQAAADRAVAQEREAADRATAEARKLADLEASLAEEVALKEKYEAQLTAAADQGSKQRLEIARREAAEMKRLQQQSASGSGRGGNPLTGGPIRRFASGGNFGANEPIIVGERGPEMVQFPQAGNVIPNNRLPSRVPAPAGASYSRVDNSLSAQAEINLTDPTKLSPAQQRIVRNMMQAELQEFLRSQRRAGAR